MKRVPTQLAMLTKKEIEKIKSKKYNGLFQVLLTGNTVSEVEHKISEIKKTIKRLNKVYD